MNLLLAVYFSCLKIDLAGTILSYSLPKDLKNSHSLFKIVKLITIDRNTFKYWFFLA